MIYYAKIKFNMTTDMCTCFTFGEYKKNVRFHIKYSIPLLKSNLHEAFYEQRISQDVYLC